MATRFYLPGTSAPAGAVGPAADALWDLTAASPGPFKMATTKASTAALIRTLTETVTTNNIDGLLAQFVSDPISAQTITGTFSLVIGASESSTNMNAWTQVIIRVVSNDGSTVRGTLYAGSADVSQISTVGAANQEWDTSTAPYNSRIISAFALSSVVAQANDRIVVELGYRVNNTVSTSFTGRLRFLDDGASDMALTANLDATSDNPWIEFSADLFASAKAPPLPDRTRRAHLPLLLR